MKKMIDELWDGEISPQDTLISDNQEYRELQHRQSKNKAELIEALPVIREVGGIIKRVSENQEKECEGYAESCDK